MGRNKTIEDVEVLAVARRVFQEIGHAAPTRDIADAAGISQAVLFQRFGSKDELFFRSMTPDPPDLEALFGSYPPKDAFEDFIAIGERLAAYLRGFMPTFLKVIAFPGVDSERLRKWHSQLPFLPIVDTLAERFRQMGRDGLVNDGNPHATAVAFITTIHSMVLFEILTTHHDRKQRQASFRNVLQVLWRGLEPRPRPRKR
jgi:AcrR family transcriptional regulator